MVTGANTNRILFTKFLEHIGQSLIPTIVKPSVICSQLGVFFRFFRFFDDWRQDLEPCDILLGIF